MHLCLFEDDHVDHLLPLVYTRPVYGLRLGMRTLFETTREAFEPAETVLHARSPLEEEAAREHACPAGRLPESGGVLFLNGRYIAEEGEVLERLRAAARSNEAKRAFVRGEELVAAWAPEPSGHLKQALGGDVLTRASFEGFPEEEVENARLISRLWDLISELRPALQRDYEARVDYNIYERPGVDLHEGAVLHNGEKIYLAPGSVVKPGAVLNAAEGPIYIGRDAIIDEGAVLRGPFYAGQKAQIKTEANIDASAFGPWSKVSGQVEESIIHSLSNKAHSGFLGHSYLGRWCNIGADTNNSDLKNDYGEVALYDASAGDFEASGRQFLGFFMGDHSKCGINTMFNTGSVIGVSCNLYGAGFMPRHVPSFSWGGPQAGFTEYRLEKALHVAETVMARRDTELTESTREMLSEVFEQTRGQEVMQ